MHHHLWIVLAGLIVWSCSRTALSAKAGKNKQRSKAREEPVGPKEHAGADEAGEREPDGGSEMDFLADFAGKKRLWVITAPSYSDNYLLMMQKQIEASDGLNCRLADRDTLIVIIIQNAMMEGKIRHTTLQGQATEEAMDSDMVTKLLHYLELQHQTFSMLILKKNLRLGERFPYPVRVEAVLEVIDQLPLRKLEKVTRKGAVQRCKITKKRLVVKSSTPSNKSTKRIYSSQKQGNITSFFPSQRQKAPDKKEAIKNKVMDILSGRSRFVIRKLPESSGKSRTSRPHATKPKPSTGNKDEKQKPGNQSELTEAAGGEGGGEGGGDKPADKASGKKHDSTSDVDNGNGSSTDEENKGEQKEQNNSKDSKKKGKGKKDGKKKKKGKRGGKKSQRDSKDKAALKEFIEKLKGKRRLLVISSPSDVSSQYLKQRDDNELHSCDFALRKVTVLSILGSEHNPTLRLQHYQQDGDPQLASLPDNFKNPELISQIRKEYGLMSRESSMIVTDYDMTPNLQKVLDLPTAPSAIMKYIDSFQSRQQEREQEKNSPSPCAPEQPEKNPEAENSLLRFTSKRRLIIISAPTEDDYSLHQQLQALSGQECPMGIRHFALLKLVGKGSGASGTVELFPLNGKSQTEKETLSQDVVRNLRDQLKINRDYFSMVVVGKDGEVKAWYPSPMWTLSNIYDLVDSMELRQQELKLQQNLGIYCPEDSGGGGGDGYTGYREEAEDRYLYHPSED
ncbi:coiled-coil domain-containing protein 80-like [Astyanax mexicanus]|uniref:Coiled-coil domain-containing protein 80-like n=1 Tax=Astyanax mexicanus TaxID=7994 RepID=A0A8T2L1B7_ASTMX|nr:coiled-coil domain-containing protein 80-like [Astyanax mexicanus]